MKSQAEKHPAPEQLAAFVQGRLPPAVQAQLEPHVANCMQCCEMLSRVPDDTLVSHLHGARVSTGPAGLPDALRDHPRYRVLRQLGAGGMGVVYQAEHCLMERPVALKVIHHDLLEHPAAVDRFRQEVRAAARLAHPNIVTAYDAEQAGDLHFLVTEYVEGMSLAQWVERHGPMPAAQACDCIRQAALGLQHAFERGMVHRDIKPQNLMLTPDGQVKILDFGLARLAREWAPPEGSTVATPRPIAPGMTAADSFLGTPEYAAPEQARSARDVDIRADIYSLGCTLRFLIEGRSPGVGGSSPRIPPSLAPVLVRMLAPAPADRYATPAEVAHMLAPWSKPAAWPRRRAVLSAAAALLVLTLGGVFAWQAMRTKRADRPDTPVPSASRAAPAVIDGLPVLVVVAEEYNAGELLPVLDVLRSRYPVKIASTGAAACRPVAWDRTPGAEIKPDLDLTKGNLRADDYRGILFPGGMIAKYKNENAPYGPLVGQLIADMHRQDKCVAALGEGIRVLAAFKPFSQICLAQFSDRAPEMFPEHARWDDQPIVYASGVITGRSAQLAAEFGAKLLRVLDPATRPRLPARESR